MKQYVAFGQQNWHDKFISARYTTAQLQSLTSVASGWRDLIYTNVLYPTSTETTKRLWCFCNEITQTYENRRIFLGPLVVCLHGGGFSALTWAVFAQHLVEGAICHLMAFDQRGHGKEVKQMKQKDLHCRSTLQAVGLQVNSAGQLCRSQGCVKIITTLLSGRALGSQFR